MSNSAKKEYLQEIRKRYFLATKQERSFILDEVCTVCGFNRKYSIRLIHKIEVSYKKRKGRPKKYYSTARFDKIETVDMLSDLYLTEWRFYLNFFIPAFKLIEKKRDGAKIIKKFSNPLTPYQRLMASDCIKLTVKKELTEKFNSLDPFFA